MRRTLRPTRRRRRAGSTGQALVIFVLAFTVLVGFTGLSVDVGHAYVAHRQAQDGSDAAALAGGRQMLTASMTTGVPVVPTNGGGGCCSSTVTAAHDYAQQNGYATVLNENCESYSAVTVGNVPPHLDETWFNSGFAGSCTATGGYATKVELHTPPIFSAGEPAPPDCKPGAVSRYSCIQVVITSLISNYFLSALGFPSQYTVTKATAYAQPSSNTLGTPPATAIYLYEPQSGCAAGHQCFTDGAAAPAPSRTQLSCTGGNCPTFWTRQGTKPSIFGFDGSKLSPPLTDTPAVESNGDMVINDDTTFCDPFNQGPTYCAGGPSSPAGAQGYSAPAGSLLFCQGQAGNTYPQVTPTTPNTCSPAPTGAAPAWAGIKHLNGNGTAFTPCNTTCSLTVTSPALTCPGIVLNGESVASHYSANDPCAPEAGSEYTLEPAVYPYIVINHGQYYFDSGVFEINGTSGGGPTNTTPGNGTANGIDHSGEANADFDLCSNFGGGNTCPNLKAGVWIGHGKGSFTAASAGSSGTVCAGSGGTGPGTQAGGGDQTQVSGSGVIFKLDSSAGGFVVTNEVQSVQLSSPGSNNNLTTPPVPVLIDEENSSFIHLDGQHGSGSTTNGYNGIIYQTPNATAGGVELNPGTGGNQAGTVQGQVLAYSFTTFGQQGIAVDFSGGYGGGSGLSISSSGHNESSIIVTNNNKYSPRAVDNGNGTETFSLDYTDEWALDGYDTYIKINSGTPIFFSQGVWPACSGSCQTPPQSQSPSDNFPHYHDASNAANYSYGPGRGVANELQGAETVASTDDWIYNFTSGGQQYSFETLGQWTWGHEKDLSGNSMGNPNLAEINLTFPKPSGTSFTLSIFMEDGDHCGDYASAQYTFPVAGGTPGTGTVQAGGVSLEE